MSERMGNLGLDDIRIFTEVVLAGSFTGASRKLGIPKSTVSRRLGELEDRLGVLLLQRTTRKLSLTHAGEILFSRASRIMDEIDDAQKAVLELQSEPRGILRITTPGDFSRVMSQLVNAFQKRYPLVDVVLFPTGRRVDLVAEGYDLALRGGVAIDTSLVSKLLLRTRLVLVASPWYLEECGAPTTVEELSAHRCLVFSNENVEGDWELEGPEGLVRVHVRGRFAARDTGFLSAAAAAGDGIAFVPFMSVAGELKSGALVRVLEEYSSPETALRALYPSPRHLSPKVRAFIDFATEWLEVSIPEMLGCSTKAPSDRSLVRGGGPPPRKPRARH